MRLTLKPLQDLNKETGQNSASTILILMLEQDDEIHDLSRSNEKIARIADPNYKLYHAFGFGKGSLSELFGPQVWLPGAMALLKGCGVGHLAGEILTTPSVHSTSNLPDVVRLLKVTGNEPPSPLTFKAPPTRLKKRLGN